jgi:hypothetical protein
MAAAQAAAQCGQRSTGWSSCRPRSPALQNAAASHASARALDVGALVHACASERGCVAGCAQTGERASSSATLMIGWPSNRQFTSQPYHARARNKRCRLIRAVRY